jgi:soluble lytic murein transglycosylase-like protein
MQEIIDAIQSIAKEQKINPKLFQAICTVESSLKTNLVRFESGYSYLYQTSTWATKLLISQETEAACQKFSYGLGQVMGAVCREYGYKENLMNLATDWKTALKYSAIHLAKYLKNRPNTQDAIASYNAGSVRKTPDNFYLNQGYVNKVMHEFEMLSAV